MKMDLISVQQSWALYPAWNTDCIWLQEWVKLGAQVRSEMGTGGFNF